jgi:hypothetical protein
MLICFNALVTFCTECKTGRVRLCMEQFRILPRCLVQCQQSAFRKAGDRLYKVHSVQNLITKTKGTPCCHVT